MPDNTGYPTIDARDNIYIGDLEVRISRFDGERYYLMIVAGKLEVAAHLSQPDLDKLLALLQTISSTAGPTPPF